MRFLFLSFCLCIISTQLLKAQLPSFEGSKSTSSVFLQKIVPPSPTAASLGRYGDQKLNMFTGTPSVNIPIYDIKTNGIELPLSLSYSTSGLRVTEAASWVGLGWSLGGTGVITRVVKGAPDGVRSPVNIRTWPLPLSYGQVNDNGWNYLHPQIQLGLLDAEPDIYIVKAGKLSVKFYYDLYNRIQTIPYNNDIKIKYDGANDQYTITDADGTQYFFGGSQANEVTYSANPAYAAYTTSWFITKITSPVGAQILFNNSKGASTILQDQYSESEEVKPTGQSGDCAGLSAGGRTTSWSSQTFQPVFLNSIETDREIVYLNRDATQRADMPGDYALTGIRVYSKFSGKYEYNFSLSYSYFPQASTVCWGSTASPQHLHNQTAICKRLRLDKFLELGFEGNNTPPKTYQFQYNTTPIPPRCSLDQDFWGYYNGAGNTSLLPVVTDPAFASTSYNAISRESNPNYSCAGMLQQIIYPTGGESDFTYEPNLVSVISNGSNFQSTSASLSGISPNFEAVTTFTIASMQQVTLNYTLSDPNLLDQGLQRRVQILDNTGAVMFTDMNSNSPTNGVIVTGNSTVIGGLPAGTYTLKVSRNYLYSSYPAIPAVGIIATVTYSPTATVTIINRNIGGFRIRKIVDKTSSSSADLNYKEYFYDNPYFVANIQNSDCISTYFRWGTSPTTNLNFQCNFKSRTVSSTQPIGSVQGGHIAYGKVSCNYGQGAINGKTEYYYSVDGDQGGFSLTPYYRPITSYDHRRGNLLKQIDYDAAGNINKITANSYEYILKYAGSFSNPYYSRDEPLGQNVVSASLLPFKVISFADFAVPSEWVRIKNTAETIYEGGSYSTVVKEFSYDNSNYSYVTQTKSTNSKGNVITELKKYPLDYKPTTTASNEEIERKFETDYQTLYNTFVSCDNAAANSTALNSCYLNYQTGYDNLINIRNTALANYQAGFTTLANGTSDPVLKGEYQLIASNKVDELIENTVTKDVTTELEKNTNSFKNFTGNILLEKMNKSIMGNVQENIITVNAYDPVGNILQATPREGVVQSFVWDYNNKFPIARAINAPQTGIAYTSFEADGTGNWTIPTTLRDATAAVSGKQSYNLSNGAISKAGLTIGNIYTVSYWSQNGSKTISGGTSTARTGSTIGLTAGISLGTWTYFEHTVTANSTTITISGSGLVDELRLYPQGALMTTYTYAPLIGETSMGDPNGKLTYYDYDSFNRLKNIKDFQGNILKNYQYNYVNSCGTNCYVLPLQTFSGSNTLSYPVGVFDLKGNLLGNASTQAQYLSIWNANATNTQTGTITAGYDSMHFNINMVVGKSVPANLIGCRFYQFDLSYNVIDNVMNLNAVYVDFGDGNKMRMGNSAFDTVGIVLAPNTSMMFYPLSNPYNNHFLPHFIHTYPDTTKKTITFYHTDGIERIGLDNFNNPATSLTKLNNLRGNIPQNMQAIQYSSYQQSSGQSFANVSNWPSINSVTSFYMNSGDGGVNLCTHLGYAQDFMAGNTGLNTIVAAAGCLDTTFRISRLKSNWNTYFTNLSYIVISDAQWKRENLSALNKLNHFELYAVDIGGSIKQVFGPSIPIPSTVIDNVINQIASGSGQYVSNGFLFIRSAGTLGTSASTASITLLKSKGWQVYVNDVLQ